ncbi:MAG: ATP-binding protein [Dehalococcoidales bacterium]|jgi:nitrogen-specific signal transduction histidine kinase
MSDSESIFYRMFTARGRFGTILVLSFAFCTLAASLVFFAFSLGKPYMGASLSLSDRVWTVAQVDHNGIAHQAGIGKGDRPIEINGQPAEIFLEKYEGNGLVFSMLLKEMTVIDNSGQIISVALEDSSPTWQSFVDQFARFTVTLIFWITGFFVLLKRPRNTAALLLCLSGMVVGLGISGNMAAGIAVFTALELQVVATIFGPWLLLHFFLVLPDERSWLHNKPLMYLIYLPAIITLILFFTIGYADGQPVLWFRNVRLLEAGAGLLTATGVAIFNYYHTVSLRTRQQMKIVLISCLAALVPFLVLYLIPETIWGQSILPPEFSILTIGFIPIGMGYAIATQKLLDIDIFIRRGVIYGTITLVMAVILSASIIPVMAHHELWGVPEEIALALLLGAVATVLFGPVKNGIEILVDRFFYKDRYDYRQIIQSLSTSSNLLKELTDISRLVVGTTVNTLNLAGGSLFVKTNSDSFEVAAAQGIYTDMSIKKQLLPLISERSRMIEFPNSASTTCSDLAFLIPLRAGGKETGILCLSHKVSRQLFSPNDMYLLQGIASVAAMALHSAMLIRDVSMRDTFVSVASHELRTPLTSIMGYSDLLLRHNPPKVKREQWLKNIFDNSQRLSTMLDDLLNVSRIQSGKPNIKLERVMLSDLLDETLSLTRERTNKHELISNIEPEIPDVLVDRDKFSQVVGNLLYNAVKYSPDGGHITLSAHNDKERHRIVVSVADEGIGISLEDIDLLFTTFHRIQRPETKGIRGSGLGLYIAKEWTKVMGGEIWVESELNKGSIFFIAVPTQDWPAPD